METPEITSPSGGPPEAAPPLLEVKNLKASFLTGRGRLTAVDGVSFSVQPGEITGIVGESGCGKSVLAQSILRLLEHTNRMEYEGEIKFENSNLLSLPLKELCNIRGDRISMIFQDPLTSLNPVYTAGTQIREALCKHRKLSIPQARARAIELLREVGIPSPEKRFHSYPHELSGGMQQRVMIAIALACEPRLLIADEPTTALDTTIQAQILELIGSLNRKNNMAVLFISHDLGVIAEICGTVRVMYLGQIVEEAHPERIFTKPLHPYTQGLLKSIPRLDGDRKAALHVIPGAVPSLEQTPQGCRFAERCVLAGNRCFTGEPPVEIMEQEGRSLCRVKCWRYVKDKQTAEENAAHRAGPHGAETRHG
ncbi:MAG: ABC transporter ATP-binding protein [Spirochaetaceae bacterium]|jgi:oligopeptide/dipeptide ABC transporter ATP-binding protein|nr:ABC transporter ATP-binding protein [Spirochaetaceae bacterium]